MIDPLTALATIKGGITAGKQLYSMTKEISSFFDSVDGAKKKHQKKKSSIFASANEEAMDTFMAQQKAKDAEAQLKEIIISTRGYTAYQDLLKIRREIRIQRKEDDRLANIKAEERRDELMLIGVIVLAFLVFAGGAGAYLWHLGFIKF